MRGVNDPLSLTGVVSKLTLLFCYCRMTSYVDNVRKNVVGLGQVQELGRKEPQVYCFLIG